MDINQLLAQYNLRAGAPYLSGAHTMTAQVGPFGVPYWALGLTVQTTKVALYSAPEPFKADVQFRIANQIVSNPVSSFGQAPTSGVYTGVVDDCR